jgi:hypothetical protein
VKPRGHGFQRSKGSVQQERGSYREDDGAAADDISCSLAAVDERLDGLAQQIERMTQADLGRRSKGDSAHARGSAYVSDALGRLNQRLDQIISEGRAASRDFQRRITRASPSPPQAEAPPPPRSAPDPANWAAEISARQRALDSEPPSLARPQAAAPLPAVEAPAIGLAGVQQLQCQTDAEIALRHQAGEGVLAALRSEIAELGQAVREALPHRDIERLESLVRSLGERLDSLQHGAGKPLVFTGIEDHIARLAEQLNACDARLERLDAIERELRDLRASVDEICSGKERNDVPLAVATAAADVPEPRCDPPPGPTPPASGSEDRPTGSDLLLEPGSGARNAKSASAAARIAASEAALAYLNPAAAETGGRLAALAAARDAARSANLAAAARAVKPSQAKKRAFLFGWPSKTAPEVSLQEAAKAFEASTADTGRAAASAGKRMVGLLQMLLIAATFIVIVVGALQTTMEILRSRRPAPPPEPAVQEVPKALPPESTPGHTTRVPDDLPDTVAADAAPASAAETTGQFGRVPSFVPPWTAAAPGLPLVDGTGSLLPPLSIPPAPRAAAAATTTSSPPAAPAISPLLQAALAANDPAAQYEMGIRYAEGRGVMRNLEKAARWLERAANAGFVPAQFRLAGLYEKGEGLKKDLQAARRLYGAAAAKGNAKAMHNLAVLYAEGIDGTPDYTMAAYWFRKAAGYGVADSQYNLAILYARGIGVEANLGESYKWFALAALSGDADAGKKRDEVGARLDQQTLVAARLAAQTFVAQREPDEATNLKAPPGGWDRPPAQAAKVRTGSLR